MLGWLIETDIEWVLMLARVVLGVVFFAHGTQKLLGWFGGPGLSATLRTFRDQLRIPAALTCLAITAEFFGGLGLIVGLLTRVAALGVAVTIAGALLTVHLKNGFFLNWFGEKQGHGIEYHLLVIALAVLLMVKGAGAFSFDAALYPDTAVGRNIESTLGMGNGR